MIIAVSGATGNIGRRVAELLAGRGLSQRLILRDRAGAPPVDAEIAVISSYADAARLTAALTGTTAALMISGKESADRLEQHRAFVDAAAAAGVPHLVYTSFHGAAPDSVFTHGRLHWATEQYIRSAGIHFTFLRDNLYADFAPALISDDGAIRGPAGDGRASMVAQEDVAAVAAEVLADPAAHRDAVYDLTGPDEWSMAEVAGLLSEVLDRPVRYEQETVEEAYASRAHYGAPDWEVDAWVSTYTAIAAGEMGGVSEDVRAVTGRPALALPEVLRRR